MGRAPAEVLTVRLEENQVSVRVTMVNTSVELEFQGEDLGGMGLNCRVDLTVTEYERELSGAQRELLAQKLEELLLSRLEGALDELGRLQADCVGLGLRGAALHPARWKEIREQWPARFGILEREIDLQVILHE